MITKKLADGKVPSVWDRYNPKLYLLILVQVEDERRFKNKDLYERRLIKIAPETKVRQVTIKIIGIIATMLP